MWVRNRKTYQKNIVDAERHRRTPWTLAVWSKAIESMKSADIGDTDAEQIQKNVKISLK